MPRRDRLEPFVAPRHRFLWGISLLLCFLFARGLIVRTIFTLLFALLAGAAGKRIRYLYFLIITLSITVFHLLTPWGTVLFSLWGVDVTRGALISGLTKGITISGLVFVSLFSVSRDLRLPGRFGRLLGRSFYYFESLYGEKRRVRRASFLSDIDDILLSLFPAESGLEDVKSGGSTSPLGAALILASTGTAAALTVASLSFAPFF